MDTKRIYKIFNIDFEDYNRGGKFISFVLGLSVVVLGVFFYEKYEEVKQNLLLNRSRRNLLLLLSLLKSQNSAAVFLKLPREL